jgi:hypothetical protein
MRRIAVATVLLALVAGALVAGCGSSSRSSSSTQVSARTYVAALCRAVLPFERNLVVHGALLNKASPKNTAASKKALQNFFSAVAYDTSSAATRIRQAGSPDVKDGPRISAAIGTAFRQLTSATRQAVNRAASLPTGNQKAFRSAASKLFAAFRSAMGGIGTSLQTNALSSPELQKAAKNTPACKTT